MFTSHASLLIVGLGLLVLSCGGGEGETNDGAGGGPRGTGGTTTGPETGGSTGDGDVGTGGSLSPGNTNIPTTVPSDTCASRQHVYRGSVGGVAIDEDLSLSGVNGGSDNLHVHSNGFIIGEVLEYTPEAVISPIVGVLGFPDESARAGEIWCIDEGSLQSENAYSYVGHLLGTCPGTPVTGEIVVCEEENDTNCAPTGGDFTYLSGMFGAKDAGNGSSEWTTLGGGLWQVATSDYKVYVLASESLGAAGSSANVTGIMWGMTTGADPGAVYCIGGGTWTVLDDYTNRAVLTDVSLVGNCNDAPAAENLEGCHGY